MVSDICELHGWLRSWRKLAHGRLHILPYIGINGLREVKQLSLHGPLAGQVRPVPAPHQNLQSSEKVSIHEDELQLRLETTSSQPTMPPSQLKRLRASLREQGITGAQKSKKQKKDGRNRKDASDPTQRTAALQQIRDSFNPFEFRASSSRPVKFQHTTATNGAGQAGKYKHVLHRPSVTKSAGEDMRRQKLLPEMQRRHKVGGMVDRRIGEGDPGMTAEERAVQRFAREKQRKKSASLFDLEASDDDDPKVGLTHGGRAVDDLPADDFEDGISEEEYSEPTNRKRRRGESDEAELDGDDPKEEQTEVKRSKKEVMQEVIAKSKLHKYERQKTKEDDDDLREELDKGMPDLLAVLKGHKPLPALPKAAEPVTNNVGPFVDPDRQKLMDGMDRTHVDREYDARLKELAQDTRAKPAERTKTEEEKIRDGAERLRDLEERRMERMRGEQASDEEDEAPDGPDAKRNANIGGDDDVFDEAAEFGLRSSNVQPSNEQEKTVPDDEDEFALDEDLIASGSDVDFSNESESDEEYGAGADAETNLDDEEAEFVEDFLADRSDDNAKVKGHSSTATGPGLAYAYPCPRSHEELLHITNKSPIEQLPTIIQRIRALHHPSLSSTNKESMAEFSCLLVDHLSYMGFQKQPLAITEQVIRHIHSLSRTYAETIAAAFRTQMQNAHRRKDLHAGDLAILTAIGSIYPTSDHFHPVVTPAMVLMARWLSLNAPTDSAKHAMGSYLVALCVNYQKLSRRYIPEALRFTLHALGTKPAQLHREDGPGVAKAAHVENLMSMAELWKDESAFTDGFTTALPLLQKGGFKRELQILNIMLQQAHLRRRPLELHHHRPVPIRASIPKFEEGFNPDKHYDPDKERSDANKLQKEYKRERKGALRELRKDANFVARQQLVEKKARDAEYEKKYRRLVAEVQGEEGHAAKEYEREKRARKSKR